MADAPPAAVPAATPTRAKKMPLWGWGAIAAGVAIVYYLVVKSRTSAKSTTAPQYTVMPYPTGAPWQPPQTTAPSQTQNLTQVGAGYLSTTPIDGFVWITPTQHSLLTSLGLPAYYMPSPGVFQGWQNAWAGLPGYTGTPLYAAPDELSALSPSSSGSPGTTTGAPGGNPVTTTTGAPGGNPTSLSGGTTTTSHAFPPAMQAGAFSLPGRS